MALLPAVRREMKALDATLPIGSPASMSDVKSNRLADRLRARFTAVVTWYDLLPGGDGGW
jgi:hypothetical protein